MVSVSQNGIQEKKCANLNDDFQDPLTSFSFVCEEIRQNMETLVALKNSDLSVDKNEIIELRMQGSFHFLSLKQLNRLAQVRCKKVKDSTLETKQKLDGYNLQLQNLEYEISHLHKEITKCMEFRSRHDDIVLVDVKKFYNDAPPHISKPEVTKTSQHNQTLARLDWELEQRKRLADKVNELKQAREDSLEKIGKKKQDLQMLAPALDNLLKSSQPLQEALDLPFEQTRQQQELANLLPRPLFVFFLQAKAYQEACDRQMAVMIEGDVAAARKLHMLDARRVTVAVGVGVGDRDGNESADSDQDEHDEQDSGRRNRKKGRETDAEMEVDVSDATDVISVLHPLSVRINLNINQHGVSLELKFSFLNEVGLVVVKTTLHGNKSSLEGEREQLADKDKQGETLTSLIELIDDVWSKNFEKRLIEDDCLLKCLLPGDYGADIPEPGALLARQSNFNLTNLFTSASGRPYMWAQRLCGLELLTKHSEPEINNFKHMHGALTQIRRRIRTRLSLSEQVHSFLRHEVPCSAHLKSLISPTIASTLQAWDRLDFAQYSSLEQNKSVIELGVIDAPHEHVYFLASLSGAGVQLKAAVVVFADYPRRAPLITLMLESEGGANSRTAADDYNVREMEVEVNVEWPKRLQNKDDTLSAQIFRLMEMLDVYAEADQPSSPGTGSAQFATSVCLRRGPARLRPLVFNPDTQRFSHRL